jgi:putative hydrolase of the HAD superfamily
MKLPKMILLDYGHTLVAEPGYSTINGTKAIMEHVTSNPQGLSAEQVNEMAEALFQNERKKGLIINLELTFQASQRLQCELLQLEFDLPYEELELIYWDGASSGIVLPHVNEMLGFVSSMGIRLGVVSNISFSGASLEKKIKRLLPGFKPEFVIASSEYMVRKPNRLIFDLALKKARLNPEDAWFCGDNIFKDVMGSHSAGIFPVWYDDCTMDNPFGEKNTSALDAPSFEHLHIHDWLELVEVLKGL